MAMQDVLDAALRLSETERLELADRLYESLHDAEDGSAEAKFEYEAEWTAEINRRVQEVREGRAKLIDGPTALARARAIIEGARRTG